MKAITYIFFGVLMISACTGGKEKPTEISADQISDTQVITLTPAQVEAIKIKTGKMVRRNLAKEIRANGYLEVPPQNRAVISPMITGYVRKVNFLVGDNVRKGQVMAELESMEYIDLQQQYLELNSRIPFLEEDYNRQKLLRDQDAVSRKTSLLAEVNYNTTLASLDGLRAKLNMLGIDLQKLGNGEIETRLMLKTPISGSVRAINVSLGEHVAPSEVIYEVVNTEHLHLELSVYEQDVIKVKKGQKVWFSIPSIQGKHFEGEVFLVGRDLSQDKRSVNVHVHIDESAGPFSVGMYANASIVMEESSSLTLPVTAFVVQNENKYIFRKVAESEDGITFRKMKVTTGIEKDDQTELLIFEGITPEDDIVTSGAFYLFNAFSVGEN
jgi:membrane fusion protein, heavy metal efflux system